MAMREATDKMKMMLHPSKEFSPPIPTLVKEAEGSTDRIDWLWNDFCKSMNRHLSLSKNAFGRPRNQIQQVAFCNGVERLCAEFTRRCQNLTITADTVGHHNPRHHITLRIHRLREVPLKDRHQRQSFVATIPEFETTVPVRATFVGMQECSEEAAAVVPLVVAAEAIPMGRLDATSSSLVYAEVVASTEAAFY